MIVRYFLHKMLNLINNQGRRKAISFSVPFQCNNSNGTCIDKIYSRPYLDLVVIFFELN